MPDSRTTTTKRKRPVSLKKIREAELGLYCGIAELRTIIGRLETFQQLFARAADRLREIRESHES